MEKIIIFGTGKRCENICKSLFTSDSPYEIIAFSDNDISKQGKNFKGFPVIAPSQINGFDFDKIFICSIFEDEIFSQLSKNLLISSDKIIKTKGSFYFIQKMLLEKYSEYYQGNLNIEDEELKAVLDYISMYPLHNYCYSFIDKYKDRDVQIFRDEIADMFYVMENNKRMYFSRVLNTEKKVIDYYNSISLEQDNRSPHKYEYGYFTIDEGDIGIDAGVAEGNFALSVIDKVSKIYLIESDDEWIEALNQTFRPYKDKVVIIKGYLSDSNLGEFVTLDNIIEDKKIDFIKMDIEGYEVKALYGSEKLLSTPNLKVAICVYHNRDDNIKIKTILDQHDFITENTKGYIFFVNDNTFRDTEADFTKALIIGKKNDTSSI